MRINNDDLEVVIERKKIKNIYFRINEQKQIYVTCPRLVTKKEIDRLLNDNIKSLEKMYQKVLKENVNKEKVLLLGNELEYVYDRKIKFIDGVAYGPSIDAINT